LDSYLNNFFVSIDNTNPRFQYNFPILEDSKGISFEEKLDICNMKFQPYGRSYLKVIQPIFQSLWGKSKEALGRYVFKSNEELDIPNDIIPSYSNIVTSDPLDVFNGLGCNMDIKSYKDLIVVHFLIMLLI